MSGKIKSEVEKFVAGHEELYDFSGLSVEECTCVLKEADKGNFVIEGIQCNTSKEEDYFQCHVWNLFCEDYLFNLEGWYWRAFEHHLGCYAKEVLASDPEDAPLFEVAIAKEYSDQGRAQTLNALVEELRADPSYEPKSFDVSKTVIGLEVD